MSSKRGVISTEYKAMLYIIGVSFSAEWGIKGIYENTIGRVTALIRGSTKTAEDEFAIKAWDEYNVFLQNAPWFEHAFGRQLGQFWRETSLVKGNPIRKLERRFAFSLEWGVKTIYARLIGAGAAATMPGAAKVRSVVADLDASDVAADPRIAIIKKLDTGHTIIETDRYQTLTEILQGLAVRGRNMSEIAGNTHILVTVQGPPGAAFASKEATVLFTVPVLVKDGWQRAAVDVKVSDLTEFLRKLKTSNIVLEHIYDY